MRPELTRDTKRFVNLNRLFDADCSILVLRGVVQFHQGGVPRTGIIPAVGALLRQRVQPFHHGDRPVGLQLLEVGSQRGAHDPTTD